MRSSPRTLRRFRRDVAATILSEASVEADASLRDEVVAFVDERITSMAAHLRGGVMLTEILLLVRSSFAPRPRTVSVRSLRRWEASALPPVRQYVSAIRSLVLVAAHELAEQREGSHRW